MLFLGSIPAVEIGRKECHVPSSRDDCPALGFRQRLALLDEEGVVAAVLLIE